MDTGSVVRAALCALGVIALTYWYLAIRSRRSGPRWEDDELPPAIARRLKKIFASHGIEASVSGDVTSFDMTIPGHQFPQRPGAIAIVCRSRNFLVGETLFSRIQESAIKVSGWTVMLAVTVPITAELTYLGKAYSIPVLDMNEIQSFAHALQSLKQGIILPYSGRSLLIKQFLTKRFFPAGAKPSPLASQQTA